MANKKKLRKIDHDMFKIGAIWYYRSHYFYKKVPFREYRNEAAGFYQIVSKQSRGNRILQKIYPEPLGKVSYYIDKALVVDDTKQLEFECGHVLQKKQRSRWRPVYAPNDEKGAVMRLLYGKRLKTQPRKREKVSDELPNR